MNQVSSDLEDIVNQVKGYEITREDSDASLAKLVTNEERRRLSDHREPGAGQPVVGTGHGVPSGIGRELEVFGYFGRFASKTMKFWMANRTL